MKGESALDRETIIDQDVVDVRREWFLGKWLCGTTPPPGVPSPKGMEAKSRPHVYPTQGNLQATGRKEMPWTFEGTLKTHFCKERD